MHIASRPAPSRSLRHGEFFGAAKTEVHTHSFVFASMRATWEAGEIPLHAHDNAYFMFVLSGKYITDASPSTCGPLDLIFNPPGTVHRDRFASRAGNFFTISVDPKLTPIVLCAYPRPRLVRGDCALAAVHEARGVLHRYSASEDFTLEALGLELTGLAALLSDWPDSRAPQWLLRARDYIRDCCTTPFTVAQLAAQSEIHPVHLARAFRQYFRCSPGDYLRRCRIEHARHLLRTSDTPLAHLAQALGYCDQAQFTKAFQRATGFAPGQFRRQLAL